MEDLNQFQVLFPRLFVGCKQIVLVDFVTVGSIAFVCVFHGHGKFAGLHAIVRRSEYHAATFLREALLRVVHHRLPRLGFYSNHSSSQNGSLRYFEALSHRNVTITPRSPSRTSSLPTLRAATRFAPADIPTRMPSSRPALRVIAYASSVSI